jgi:putative oxidoreductase
MSADLGLFLLRLVVGLLLAGHGAQKLFGWFGGFGFAATRDAFGDRMRLRPAFLWTAMGGLSEVGGGILMALGLFSPLGSLGVIAAMLMAIVTAHWGRLWASEGGMEYPLTLLVAALTLGLTGPGRLSMDSLLHFAPPEPATLLLGLVLVVLGVATALVTRAPQSSAPAMAQHSEAVQR